MSGPEREFLVFEMGLYKAQFPKDLLYSPLHFWMAPEHGKGTRIGLTRYATRLLGDVFRIDWAISTGKNLLRDQQLASMESTKAVSELYAPLDGCVRQINAALTEDPSLLSVDPYDAWMVEVDGWPQQALQAQEYLDFLASGWERTMAILKGQQ